MAGGILCSVAGCGYVTRTKVDDDLAPALQIRVERLKLMELQIHTDSVHVFPPACTPGTTAVQMSKSAKKRRRKEGSSYQTKVQCMKCCQPAHVSRPLSLSWVKELASNERFWTTEEVVFVCHKDTVRTSPATAAQMDLSKSATEVEIPLVQPQLLEELEQLVGGQTFNQPTFPTATQVGMFNEDADEKDGSTKSSGVTCVWPKHYRNDDVPEVQLHVSGDLTDTEDVDLTERNLLL